MKPFLFACIIIGWATASVAHQLSVFASVDDGTVTVETKFSNGNIPVSGQVMVLDGDNTLLLTVPLETDGTAKFPLDMDASAQGLMITVETGEGHDDYWILTPEDIAHGMED